MINKKNVLICLIIIGGLWAAPLKNFTFEGDIPKGKEITLGTALNRLLDNNLSIQMMKYEVLKSDSNLQKFQTKFSPFISAKGSKSQSKLDRDSLDALYGTRVDENELGLKLGKNFRTGTLVVAGYKNEYMDILEPSPLMTGRITTLQNPTLFIMLQQKLLKNSFGYNDRRQQDILVNMETSNRRLAEYQIAGLLTSGAIDYLSLGQAQEKLHAAQGQLYAYEQIYKAVKKNVAIGLFEDHYLNQFNALIASSKMKIAMNETSYKQSKLKLLNDLNLKQDDQEIDLVSLTTNRIVFDRSQVLRVALKQRADVINARLAVDSAEKYLAILRNKKLPEATLSYQAAKFATGKDYQETYEEAMKDKYNNWEAKLEISKILNDKQAKISVRDAKYQLEQAKLKLVAVEKQVEVDVDNSLTAIASAYEALEQSQIMVDNAQQYLDTLLAKVKQGRISTVELKDAVDMRVGAHEAWAEVLSKYNMALIQLDLVTNSLLTKYKVDIDKILEEIK